MTEAASTGVEVAQHDLPLELRAEAEVELLDGGGKGEGRVAQAALSRRGRPGGHLLIKQALEEVGVAQLLLSGAGQPGGQDGGGPLQMHQGQCGGQVQRARVPGRAHAPTPTP